MNEGFDLFRTLLVDWLENSRLFPKKNLHIDLILNPHAGAFRHKGRCEALIAGLNQARASVRPEPEAARTIRVSTWTTDYPGHEKAILAHLQAADPVAPGDQRLVVTAGGDGTSRGALISALELPPEVRESLLFFRLPLGTGNDASDARTWPSALAVLSGRGAVEFTVKPLPVLEVAAAGQPLHHSFNIASVGLDAFVNFLTNKFKRWFPGNSYSLMVDAASFFYEVFVQVVPSRVLLTEGGRTVVDSSGMFLLAAMGTSGRRTYGAGKRVLPDEDNFCMAGKKNLFSKLALRKPFYTGTHRGLPGITLARGDQLTIESRVRLPLQMDGEDLWLAPENFPLTMTVTDRGLRVLTLAGDDDRS